MRRAVDHAALSAVGYFTDLGVKAGKDAVFHLSSADPGAQARVLRLDRAAEGESTGWPVVRTDAALAVQNLDLGAWLSIMPPDRLSTRDWALELEFRLAGSPENGVLIADEGATVRFAADGALVLEAAEVATGQILPIREWLNARLCSTSDRISLSITKSDTALNSLAVA